MTTISVTEELDDTWGVRYRFSGTGWYVVHTIHPAGHAEGAPENTNIVLKFPYVRATEIAESLSRISNINIAEIFKP